MKKQIFISVALLSFITATGARCENHSSIAADGKSGTCGVDCTWSYDQSTRTLSITGTSADATMDDWTDPSYEPRAPWLGQSFSGQIQKINVSGVSHLGNQSFSYLGGVQSISLDNKLQSIGAAAFNRVNMGNTGVGLELVIPDSVTTINDSAFYYTGIKNLTVPDTLTSNSMFGSNPYIEKISCAGSGNLDRCNAILRTSGTAANLSQVVSRPNYRIDENGNVVETFTYDTNGIRTGLTSDGRTCEYDENGNFVKSYKNYDNATSYYDQNGKITGITGKRHLTVEQAAEATKNGKEFSVSITW